jgi:hypothetical protein
VTRLESVIAAARDAGRTGSASLVRGLRLLSSAAHTARADAIAAQLASTPLASLAVRQIREPQEEARLRATIPPLTEVVNRVSAAVRDQYEANPYPRWLRIERDVAANVRRSLSAQPVSACRPRRSLRRAGADPDRGMRHRPASDRHGAAVSRFERARDRS